MIPIWCFMVMSHTLNRKNGWGYAFSKEADVTSMFPKYHWGSGGVAMLILCPVWDSWETLQPVIKVGTSYNFRCKKNMNWSFLFISSISNHPSLTKNNTVAHLPIHPGVSWDSSQGPTSSWESLKCSCRRRWKRMETGDEVSIMEFYS
jgi:hypothetical protein